jgi:hypothetical protein
VLLLLLFVGIVMTLAAALSVARTAPRRTRAMWSCMAAPVLAVVAVGMVMHFRVLGRHLAPAVTLLGVALAAGLQWWWDRRNRPWPRAVVVAVLAGWLASCLCFRFAPRHAKDDYRRAAAIAKESSQAGRCVWWAADRDTARFYGVPLGLTNGSGGIVLQPDAGDPALTAARPQPQVVILSKIDLYDPTGRLSLFLADRRFEKSLAFPGFAIWRAPAGSGVPAVR